MEIDNHTLSRPVMADKSKGLGGNPAAAAPPPSPGNREGALPCSPEVEEVTDDLDVESLLLFSAADSEPVFSSTNKAICHVMRCDSSERVSCKHNNNNSNGSIHEIERTGESLPDGLVASLFVVAMTNNKLSSMKTT